MLTSENDPNQGRFLIFLMMLNLKCNMRLQEPKDSEKISWTKHSIEKMRYYRLSENRLKRVMKNPDRKQEGIVPGTLAVMQRTGSKKHPTEIWIMYQKTKSRSQNSRKPTEKVKVISAWRYPGISPKEEEIPIPEDILEELNKFL